MKALVVAVNQEKFPYPVMPIGAAQICATLEQNGHEIEMLDLMFCADVDTALRQAIHNVQPQTVLISIRNTDNQILVAPVSYLPLIRRVVDMVRFLSDAQIIVGGTGFTSYPRELYELLRPDFGIAGEGEVPLSQLLNHAPPEDIAGLVYSKTDGQIVCNPVVFAQRPAISQSRALAYIDTRHYLKKGSYVGIQTRRGCPRQCIYCSDNIISGKKVRTLDPEKVVDDIRKIKDRHGVGYFFFVDELFSDPIDYAKEFLKALIASEINIRFEIEDAPPNFDEEYITLLKAAGCLGVSLTVDSGSDAILKTIRKGFGKQHIVETCDLLHRLKLPYYIIALLGNPGETMDTVKESFTLFKSLPGASAVIINCGLRIPAGARIAAMAKEKGWIDAADDLLVPKYFLSKDFDDAVLHYIQRQCRQNPGWITMSHIDQYLIKNLFDRMKFLTPRPEWKQARVMTRLMKPLRKPLSWFIEEIGFDDITDNPHVVFG